MTWRGSFLRRGTPPQSQEEGKMTKARKSIIYFIQRILENAQEKSMTEGLIGLTSHTRTHARTHTHYRTNTFSLTHTLNTQSLARRHTSFHIYIHSRSLKHTQTQIPSLKCTHTQTQPYTFIRHTHNQVLDTFSHTHVSVRHVCPRVQETSFSLVHSVPRIHTRTFCLFNCDKWLALAVLWKQRHLKSNLLF